MVGQKEQDILGLREDPGIYLGVEGWTYWMNW